MTDRELLEYAAKAAGIKIKLVKSKVTKGELFCFSLASGQTKPWNPLTHGADAFQLAVMCGVKDYFGIEIQKTCAQATAFDPWEHCEYEPHNDDPYAATRRAITRAAAEIGKGME